MNINLKKLKESYINITDKYGIDRDNLLADTKVILCICFVIDICIIFGFSLLWNIFNVLKYGFKLRYIFPFFTSKSFYLILLVLIIYANINLYYSFKRNFKSLNINQKGSSRFTTTKEIDNQYKKIAEYGSFPGSGGVIISHYNNHIYIDDTPVNNLIIGTTRSGKGETFVITSIDIYSRAQNKASLIINDPKGEISSASYEVLKQRGYEVYIINTSDPSFSNAYNPLEQIKNAYKNGEKELAQTLTNTLTNIIFSDNNVKDKFWLQSSAGLCNAIILAHVIDCIESGQEHKINMYSVANFLNELGGNYRTNILTKENINLLEEFFSKRPLGDIAKMQYATVNLSKGQTRASIFANTMTKLQFFTMENIAKMTCKNDIDLENVGFGEKPVAIFLVTPDYDSSVHFLSSVFVKQLYFTLAKRCIKVKNGRCTREVIFMLDEFGNMPPIEDMDSIITVCLGRNIKFNLITQDYEQLKNKYGDGYKTIIGNCGNQIYLLTASSDTAEKFSRMIGNKTLKTYTRSGHFLSLKKSLNETFESRPLLNSTELTNLKQYETVVYRVIKRTDLKGKDIISHPIYNTGETRLKPRHEYLSDIFDTSKSIYEINLKPNHNDIDLKEYMYIVNKNDSKDNPNELDNFMNIESVDNTSNTKENEVKKEDIKVTDKLSEQQIKIIESKVGIDITEDMPYDYVKEVIETLANNGQIDEQTYSYIQSMF